MKPLNLPSTRNSDPQLREARIAFEEYLRQQGKSEGTIQLYGYWAERLMLALYGPQAASEPPDVSETVRSCGNAATVAWRAWKEYAKGHIDIDLPDVGKVTPEDPWSEGAKAILRKIVENHGTMLGIKRFKSTRWSDVTITPGSPRVEGQVIMTDSFGYSWVWNGNTWVDMWLGYRTWCLGGSGAPRDVAVVPKAPGKGVALTRFPWKREV